MSDSPTLARLARAERKVQLLESMIEEKTRDLYIAMRKLENSARELSQVTSAVPAAILVFGRDGFISLANETAERLLGQPTRTLIGRDVAALFVPGAEPVFGAQQLTATTPAQERICVSTTGEHIPVLASCAPIHNGKGQCERSVAVIFDIRERRRLELELRHSQKLEAVGRLAAGVAHEINTPVQFVNDSIHFLHESSHDLSALLTRYQSIAKRVEEGRPVSELIEETREFEQEIDLEYISGNGPMAFDRSIEGLDRVTSIVRTLKEFSHPDGGMMERVDLNGGVNSVLVIAHNEYKYVADVVSDLGEIPNILAHRGEINQVLLNLVVNAAHAIADRVGESGERGNIRIATRCEGEYVHLTVSDNGTGVPVHLRERIFEPFFTTKTVGRGTGQGLASVRAMVIERHQGRIALDSEVGKGTTMHIRLPIAGAQVVLPT